MKTLIKNCRLISPELEINGASIEIDGKKISRLYLEGEKLPVVDNVFDAFGKMVMPGFIDIHSHGAMGYDATDDKPEGIKAIAEAKLKEGVTTYIATTLTLMPEALEKAMRHIAAYQKNPTGSKVPGVHLEGPFINKNCAGAQNPAYVRDPDIDEVLRLNEIARVLIVSFAVEAEGGIEFTRELAKQGIVPSCGHSDASFDQFKRAKQVGLKHLTHFCNQMTKFHHREIGLVGAGIYDDDVLIEAICDKIHVAPDMLSFIFKFKSIDRIAIITDTMSAACLSDGDYDLGGLPVYVKNNAARLKSNDALAGSVLKYYDGLKNVYELTGIPLSKLVKTTSLNQARSLGFHDLGKLEAGYTADIVILDDDFKPSAVFVEGARRV
ncbi:MAG: N-acetylglucosamine-6-phosphate deacetylase [Lentisphaerae bacterium GWF2_45_14]|nr:MAG: N-acetylglucosamine-6-phosphate deacetylase [Lentisphaerae bacterium GWF2_45_14]